MPAVWVDLKPSEERLILATLDPIASMAETDAATLTRLLDELAVDDQALATMLDGLRTSITPTLPTPSVQREPELASACLIEIRCTLADRDDFGPTLDEWSERDGVQIDIS